VRFHGGDNQKNEWVREHNMVMEQAVKSVKGRMGLGAALLAGLLLGGCGGGSGGEGDPPPPVTAPPTATPSTPIPPTPPSADTTAPSAPGGLTASASALRVDLAWSASTDNVSVVRYLVQRCTGAACSSFVLVNTVTTLSYADSGLNASTAYTYRVMAEDAAGNRSAVSPTVTATTPAAATAPSGSVSLTWTAPTLSADETALSDLAGFRIYVSNTSGVYPNTAALEVAASEAGSTVQATVTGLSVGAHHFVITAFDAAGNESTPSNELRKMAQ
jgi:hypothetical protein